MNYTDHAPCPRRRGMVFAMKCRAALTWRFAQSPTRGYNPWVRADTGEWEGNPSLSECVGRGMYLFWRKVCLFDLLVAKAHRQAVGPQHKRAKEVKSVESPKVDTPTRDHPGTPGDVHHERTTCISNTLRLGGCMRLDRGQGPFLSYPLAVGSWRNRKSLNVLPVDLA